MSSVVIVTAPITPDAAIRGYGVLELGRPVPAAPRCDLCPERAALIIDERPLCPSCLRLAVAVYARRIDAARRLPDPIPGQTSITDHLEEPDR